MLPYLYFPVGTLVLGSLGFWQLKRLKWKNNLLLSLNESQQKKYSEIEEWNPHSPVKSYSKVKIAGTYFPRSALKPFVLVGPRKFDGAMGYRLILPFVSAQLDLQYLVDVGWISDRENPYEFLETFASKSGIQTVFCLPNEKTILNSQYELTKPNSQHPIMCFTHRSIALIHKYLFGTLPNPLSHVMFQCVPNSKA